MTRGMKSSEFALAVLSLILGFVLILTDKFTVEASAFIIGVPGLYGFARSWVKSNPANAENAGLIGGSIADDSDG